MSNKVCYRSQSNANIDTSLSDFKSCWQVCLKVKALIVIGGLSPATRHRRFKWRLYDIWSTNSPDVSKSSADLEMKEREVLSYSNSSHVAPPTALTVETVLYLWLIRFVLPAYNNAIYMKMRTTLAKKLRLFVRGLRWQRGGSVHQHVSRMTQQAADSWMRVLIM